MSTCRITRTAYLCVSVRVQCNCNYTSSYSHSGFKYRFEEVWFFSLECLICWLSTSHVITLRTKVMEKIVLYLVGGGRNINVKISGKQG